MYLAHVTTGNLQGKYVLDIISQSHSQYTPVMKRNYSVDCLVIQKRLSQVGKRGLLPNVGQVGQVGLVTVHQHVLKKSLVFTGLILNKSKNGDKAKTGFSQTHF